MAEKNKFDFGRTNLIWEKRNQMLVEKFLLKQFDKKGISQKKFNKKMLLILTRKFSMLTSKTYIYLFV